MKKGLLKEIIAKGIIVLTIALMWGSLCQETLVVKGADAWNDGYGSTSNNVWRKGENGKYYWYEKGIRQGTLKDAKGVIGDGTIRGREIYDPASNGWYWLDACYEGAKATSKEVWMPYVYQDEKNWSEADIEKIARNSGGQKQQVIDTIRAGSGKWVRYDEEGKMYKGWYAVTESEAARYPSQAGNIYYYDTVTGLMAKGNICIDGESYWFDEVTGALLQSGSFQVARVKDRAFDMIRQRTYPNHRDELLAGSYVEYQYDDYGNCITAISVDASGNRQGYERYEYDGQGREIRYYKCDNGVEYLYRKTDYGNKTKVESYYGRTGIPSFSITSEYDVKNQLIKETRKDGKNTVTGIDTFIYDSAGHKKSQNTYNGANVLQKKIDYVYVKNGRREELSGYDIKGILVNKETTECDSAGRCILWTGGQLISVNGEQYWGESQHYYSYDAGGDRIRHAMYNEDLLEAGEVYSYKNVLIMKR